MPRRECFSHLCIVILSLAGFFELTFTDANTPSLSVQQSIFILLFCKRLSRFFQTMYEYRQHLIIILNNDFQTLGQLLPVNTCSIIRRAGIIIKSPNVLHQNRAVIHRSCNLMESPRCINKNLDF